MQDLQLATSAIALIIFLVIPGISFKGGYYTQRFKSSLNSGSFQDRLVSTIFISIIFQICIILLNNYLFETKIDYETYTTFLKEDFLKNSKIKFTDSTLLFVLKYLLLTSLIPFLVGFVLNKLICLFSLDLYISYFRSNDYWYYYFRGDIPNDDRFKNKIKKINITDTIVDILVEVPNETKLYSGYYVNHTLKKDGHEIDTLILKDVQRYSNSKNKFVEVPGNYFKIKGDKIINVNTRYLKNELTIKNGKKTNFDSFLAISLIVGIILSFIIPFYLEGGILKLIINIILSLTLTLFSITLIFSASNTYEKNKVSAVTSISILIIIIIGILYLIN